MYTPQHAAAASANATPRASDAPVHGCVRQTTPAAAITGQIFEAPRPRNTATPSGPRNSSALAVPSGSRAIEAMKNSAVPDVTTPRTTVARNAEAEKSDGRGRTSTIRIRPAHASRSHVTPATPRSSIRLTATARPSCTHRIDTTAIEAPTRAGETAGRAAVNAVIRGVDRMRDAAVHAVGRGAPASARRSRVRISSYSRARRNRLHQRLCPDHHADDLPEGGLAANEGVPRVRRLSRRPAVGRIEDDRGG